MTRLPLQNAWERRLKLYAEGEKLHAEGDKLYVEGTKLHIKGLYAEGERLYAEGDRLHAEGDKLYAGGNLQWTNAILARHGNMELKWTWYTMLGPCLLENGDLYE